MSFNCIFKSFFVIDFSVKILKNLLKDIKKGILRSYTKSFRDPKLRTVISFILDKSLVIFY